MAGFSITIIRNPITERTPGIFHPIGHSLEKGIVGNPVPFMFKIPLEIFLLFVQGFLFSITAIHGIDGGKKFFTDRLGDIPGRITQNGIKAVGVVIEDIRELQLPVEEAQPFGHPAHDRQGIFREVPSIKFKGQRGCVNLIRLPEPE